MRRGARAARRRPCYHRHPVKVLPRVAPFLVLLAALAVAHAEIFGAGARVYVPLGQSAVADVPTPTAVPASDIGTVDATYEAWLVARHARTWWTPWRLFDTEHCAPGARTLTLGIPMLALGLLGAPAALFSDEPLWIYNFALVLWSAVAALAMYALVLAWTRSRAAALAAALLFAFHAARLDRIMHPTEWDVAWTALALYFAERLCARGRWRDAAGLAAAGALQVATSFYPLVTAAVLALPFGAWLLLRRVALRATWAQAACAAIGVALAAAWVLGPYLAARGERLTPRSEFLYMPWSAYLPGSPFFFGALLVVAALAGSGAPRQLTLRGVEGDPRPALWIGALLCAFLAAGSSTIAGFDPYAALARVVPGLDSVRSVGRLYAGVHLVACVLAGAGVAAAQQLAGRRAREVGAACVAAAWLAVFGLQLPMHWRLAPIRPPQTSVDFFAALAAKGDAGPLLELPLDYSSSTLSTLAGPPRILLEAWHRRRTSACFGSYPEPGRAELEALAARLPEREAVDALRAQGFTTVLLHHPEGAAQALRWLRPFELAAAETDPPVRLIERVDAMSAYTLVAH